VHNNSSIARCKDENRVIVRQGLAWIATTKNTGLRALIEACELDAAHLSAYHIGFIIGPCLNASGRLDTLLHLIPAIPVPFHAPYRVRCITIVQLHAVPCQAVRWHLNTVQAHEMAQELRELNEERKNMTDTEAKKAIEMVEGTDLYEDNVLVVYLPECHESVAGIIAGRLREHFYKPSIVITDISCALPGSVHNNSSIARCAVSSRPLAFKHGPIINPICRSAMRAWRGLSQAV